MERIEGRKVTDPALPAAERARIAETIVESLLAQPFWSEAPSALFHADPHAGNLFATGDGRLAILDWALVVRLGQEQRAAVMQAIVGAATLAEAQTAHAIASLGTVIDEAKLAAAVGEAFRLVRHGVFPGFDWLTGLLDGVMTSGAMRFPEELTIFRKALLTMSGVVADLGGRPLLDRVLAQTAVEQFAREAGRRPFAAPGSRAFGSHLSDADLMCTWAALFFVPSRFWLATWRDALGLRPH